jgi:hypothetical protein
MKRNIIFKTAVSLFAATIIVQTPEIKGYHNYLYKNFNPVNNAVDTINDIKENNSKNLHKVCITYDIQKNKVSAKTKIYSTQYRKKPTLKEEIFLVNTAPINAKSMTFVYNNKSDKDNLIQTIKGSKENTKIALNKDNKSIKSA